MRIVFFIGAAPDRIGLSKHAARIERKNADRKTVIEYGVRNCLVFVTETGGERNFTGVFLREHF
jgi:hypothetical protein